MTNVAPALHDSLRWLNADAQTLSDQRGRVVALLFWNAASAYCRNVVDQLIGLKARYASELSVIGVHLPRFDAEVDDRTVLMALNRLGVNFPVANDPGWVAWQHYGVSSWPSVALIDAEGRLHEILSGDDQGAALNAAIATLAEQADGFAGPWQAPRLQGAEAQMALAFPSGLAATARHLYVADTGHHRVLECNFEGRVLREFGTGLSGLIDGPASEAAFRFPSGLYATRDALYVADTGNHALRRIRLLDGYVDTLLGQGKPGQPREATLSSPSECLLDQPTAVVGTFDRLFIAVTGCNQLWEYELGYARTHLVAGSGDLGIVDGPLRNAVFAQPSGLVLAQQTLYVLDASSSALRAVHLQQGTVQTLVGHGLYEFGAQDGTPREARMQFPQAIALDPSAPILWVADSYNGKLRKLRLDGGEMSTHPLPQTPDQPAALALTPDTLWIADAGSHEILRQDLRSGLLNRVPVAE